MKLTGLEWRVFFGLWLLYGLMIDSGDLQAYRLPHAVIEALVERGDVSIGESPLPELRPQWDTFEFGGRRYAARQPGIFLIGALAYTGLHAVGLTYAKHYLLAAAWTTFLTAGLAAAAAGVALLRLARAWAGTEASVALPFLAYAVGSFWWPYTGVLHHDVVAGSFLVLALSTLFRPDAAAAPGRTAAWVGLWLGATISTSMLPLLPAVALGVATALRLGRPGLRPLAAGALLGLLPLFVYDAVLFGNPLLVPGLAGRFVDTYPGFSGSNLVAKLAFYATRLTLYAPVMWLGLVGLWRLPSRLRFEQRTLLAMVAGLVATVTSIESVGGCQFGPRYLLPLTPLLALGLVGLAQGRTARLWTAAALAVSAAISLLGALYGTHNCELDRYTVLHYLDAIRHDTFLAFPLALWLVAPLGLWLIGPAAALAERVLARLAAPPATQGSIE